MTENALSFLIGFAVGGAICVVLIVRWLRGG